ncbi:hypothetical protein ACFXP3_05065 [Streptomyces sp. NPDC059096]|uniref:hypothetical protein n=1 Tax=Streptomyces sp. NPDC059096 TaxID=3346727 RepID=UPI0036B6D555
MIGLWGSPSGRGAPGPHGRLGAPVKGLAAGDTRTLTRPDGSEPSVTAVPAVHGHEEHERDPDGEVDCQVVGFTLAGDGPPTVHLSDGNASLCTPCIDATVLHAGAARVPRTPGQPRQRPRRRGRDPRRPVNIPAHSSGWAHFTEGRAPSSMPPTTSASPASCASPTTTPGSLKP